jgi:hypothetical protein
VNELTNERMKELTIMKTTLRYLLIVVAMVSVLGAYAQGLAKQPEAQMKSTSGMVYSGSTLPQAAATGAVLTGTTVGSYTPTGGRPGHIRRDVGGGGTTEDEDEPDAPGEPNPIGDMLWPMMLLAGVYALMRVFLIVKRKKQ